MDSFVINFDRTALRPGLECTGSLCLKPATMSCLVGDNGLGKSSCCEWLMGHREIGPYHWSYAPQERLEAAIGLNFIQLKELLWQQELQPVRADWQHWTSAFEESLGINQFAHHPLELLSGGQSQVVKLYLALSLKANYYIFDEPFQYLDRKKSNFILKEITALIEEFQAAVLVIDHDEDRMNRCCQQLYRLAPTAQKGHILLQLEPAP